MNPISQKERWGFVFLTVIDEEGNVMKLNTIFFCAILCAVSGCATSSPLMTAAWDGDIDTAQKLIKNGVDINEVDSSGITPLMMAINSNKPEVAKAFIQMGADIERKDKSGCTPLIYAVSMDQYDVAKILIEKGADVNSKDLSGEGPLLLAVANGNASMVRLLIDNGADVNTKNGSGMMPLHYAASRIEQQNSDSVIKILLDNGADTSGKDNSGLTPLKYALFYKVIENVILIRTKGQGNDDLTPLSFDDALRAPSRINPGKDDFLIPPEKEKAYANAISDCNDLIISYKKMLLFVTGPIGYGAGLAYDSATVPEKFQRCMDKMGFKCIKNCSK